MRENDRCGNDRSRFHCTRGLETSLTQPSEPHNSFQRNLHHILTPWSLLSSCVPLTSNGTSSDCCTIFWQGQPHFPVRSAAWTAAAVCVLAASSSPAPPTKTDVTRQAVYVQRNTEVHLCNQCCHGNATSTSELLIGGGGGQLQETVHSTVLLGYFYLLYMLCSNLSHVYCCSFEVVLCVIVVGWPCVSL